jgi:hypothetical protein
MGAMLLEKALDEVAINGCAAIVAEIVTQRPSTAKRTEECGTETTAQALAKPARSLAPLMIVHEPPFEDANIDRFAPRLGVKVVQER